MTDVLLTQTIDGGEVSITGGLVTLSDGFDTAVYLSLFGGNEMDDGSDDGSRTYWANINETDPVRKYISETQYLLNALPPTTGNLLRLEDAGARDLQWLIDVGAVTEIAVEATSPVLNKVLFVVTINGDETVELLENWKAAA